jgi:hypothetical protein
MRWSIALEIALHLLPWHSFEKELSEATRLSEFVFNWTSSQRTSGYSIHQHRQKLAAVETKQTIPISGWWSAVG